MINVFVTLSLFDLAFGHKKKYCTKQALGQVGLEVRH